MAATCVLVAILLSTTAVAVFGSPAFSYDTIQQYDGQQQQYRGSFQQAQEEYIPSQEAEQQQYWQQAQEKYIPSQEAEQQQYWQQAQEKYIPSQEAEQQQEFMEVKEEQLPMQQQNVNQDKKLIGQNWPRYFDMERNTLVSLQAGCNHFTIPIPLYGSLNINSCPAPGRSGCQKVTAVLGSIVNTAVTTCNNRGGKALLSHVFKYCKLLITIQDVFCPILEPPAAVTKVMLS